MNKLSIILNTLCDTTPQPTPWEAIVNEISSYRHEAATRHYREVCALLAEAEASGVRAVFSYGNALS